MLIKKLIIMILMSSVLFTVSGCNSTVKREVDNIEKHIIGLSPEKIKLKSKMDSIKSEVQELVKLNKMYWWNTKEKQRAKYLETNIVKIFQDLLLEVEIVMGGIDGIGKSVTKIKDSFGFFEDMSEIIDKIEFHVNVQVPTEPGFRISEEQRLKYTENVQRLKKVIESKEQQIGAIETAMETISMHAATVEGAIAQVFAEPQGEAAINYYDEIVYSDAFTRIDEAVLNAFMVPLISDLTEVRQILEDIDHTITPPVYIAENQFINTNLSGNIAIPNGFLSELVAGDAFGFDFPKSLVLQDAVQVSVEGMQLQTIHNGSDNNSVTWLVLDAGTGNRRLNLGFNTQLALTDALRGCNEFKVWSTHTKNSYKLPVINIAKPVVFELPFKTLNTFSVN